MRRYFLQYVDVNSGAVIDEIQCGTPPLAALRRIINPESEDSDIENTYVLTFDQAEALMHLCQLRLDPRKHLDLGKHQIQLTSWDKNEGLPYRLHAGRELPLMLAGIKPLSFLYGTIPPNEHFVEIPEYLFDPYVDAGLFVKRDYSLPFGASSSIKAIRHVLYALKHEAWRVDAFILLHNTALKTGWNEALTRMEGTLLGYEEWQNDAFIEQMNQSSKPSFDEGSAII